MFKVVLRIFKKISKTYVECSSINGFKLLKFLWNHRILRPLWIIFIIVQTIHIIVLVSQLLTETYNHPLHLTLRGSQVPPCQIPFPAVALCNVNKISRRAVTNLAKSLCEKTPDLCARNPNFWMQKMNLLRGYYDGRSIIFEEGLNFEMLFEKTKMLLWDKPRGDPDYFFSRKRMDIAELLEQLAPPCEDMLLECYVNDRVVNCSQTFELSVTANGFCCIFNNNVSSRHNNSTHPKINSLGVLMNLSTADYFYKSDFWNGAKLFVFNPFKVPDQATGLLSEQMITAGPFHDILIEPTVVTADPLIKFVSPYTRVCFFPEENSIDLLTQGIPYSKHNCLFHCKVMHIMNICKCIPYMASKVLRSTLNYSLPDCTLEFAYCMNHFYETFNTFRLEYACEDHDTPMPLDSMDCTHCFNECETTIYNLHTSYYLEKLWDYFVQSKYKGMNEEDLTIVKLQFMPSGALEYSLRFSRSMCRIMSDIGGILNISMGVSFISVVEIIYFFVLIFMFELIKYYAKIIKMKFNV